MVEVGDVAPDFAVDSTEGPLTLAGELAKVDAGLVLYFYPRAMTPGCTAEACDFRDSLASLAGAGYRVVGVSPDSVERLRRFAERDGLTFPLASDPNHEVLEAYGAWGEKKNYGKVTVGVIRSTFVISPDGMVVLALRNVRAKGHVARVRRELGLDSGA